MAPNLRLDGEIAYTDVSSFSFLVDLFHRLPGLVEGGRVLHNDRLLAFYK